VNTPNEPSFDWWEDLYPHALGLVTPVFIEPLIGARYLTVARWLRDFDAWSEEHRRAWQRHRLQAVVDHARQAVPFYRSLPAKRWSDNSLDLRTLPVVDKATIRDDFDSFVARGWQRMPHVTKRTGGTSGDPWQYPLEKMAWAHMYGAGIHFWGRTGYRYGERVVSLGTPPSLVPDAGSVRTRLRSRLERRAVSSSGFDIDHESSVRRAVGAGRMRGAVWYGYAGTVAAMAEAVIADRIDVPGPRAIVTTSEMLEPRVQRNIEQAFGAPVYDEYGCNDGGVLALSCRSGRLHLAENVSIVEVLDGDEPCPPGVEGEVTVTNLHTRVLPFLRYQVGDRAVMGEGPCPCGSPGATIARLAGRSWDQIELPGGRRLSAVAMNPVFMGTPNVRRWQVLQRDRSHLEVRLEVQPDFRAQEAERIESYFRERCGDRMHVMLTTSEPIEQAPGRKHKAVMRLYD